MAIQHFSDGLLKNGLLAAATLVPLTTPPTAAGARRREAPATDSRVPSRAAGDGEPPLAVPTASQTAIGRQNVASKRNSRRVAVARRSGHATVSMDVKHPTDALDTVESFTPHGLAAARICSKNVR